MNDGEQVFEKQTWRYLPFGRKSIQDEGTIDTPFGTCARFDTPWTDVAPPSWTDDPPSPTAWYSAFTSASVSAHEEDASSETASLPPDTEAESELSMSSGEPFSTWESIGSGNAGTKEILSDEYPENDVVNQSGIAGNHDETVLSDDIPDTVLIRNSEEVDTSIRNAVFGKVSQENASLRIDPTTTAWEKNPEAVAILHS